MDKNKLDHEKIVYNYSSNDNSFDNTVNEIIISCLRDSIDLPSQSTLSHDMSEMSVINLSEKVYELSTIELRKDLSLDTSQILAISKEVIANNPDLSRDEAAIEVLKHIANVSWNTKLGKIAKKMVKEKWWEKNE